LQCWSHPTSLQYLAAMRCGDAAMRRYGDLMRSGPSYPSCSPRSPRSPGSSPGARGEVKLQWTWHVHSDHSIKSKSDKDGQGPRYQEINSVQEVEAVRCCNLFPSLYILDAVLLLKDQVKILIRVIRMSKPCPGIWVNITGDIEDALQIYAVLYLAWLAGPACLAL